MDRYADTDKVCCYNNVTGAAHQRVTCPNHGVVAEADDVELSDPIGPEWPVDSETDRLRMRQITPAKDEIRCTTCWCYHRPGLDCT